MLFAGYSDGSLKKWDIHTGNCVLHIDKQTQKKKSKEGKCLIWNLCYADGCLISGDSQGDVCIWDTEFGTQLAKLSQLSGDILAMTLNLAHGCIYATGVDSRVISIQLQKDQETNSQKWVVSSVFRGQSHDIKSLVLLDDNTLLSGGLTTDICVYKL